MAEASVDIFLMNLKRLLVFNAELLVGVEDLVESLYKEFSLLKAFLIDYAETETAKETNDLRREIRVVLFEAEDFIDTLVVEAANRRARRSARLIGHLCFVDSSLKLRRASQEVESIKEKLKKMYNNRALSEARQVGEYSNKGSSQNRAPIAAGDIVKAFDDEPEVIGRRTLGASIFRKRALVAEEDMVVGFGDEAQKLIGRLIGGTMELEVISVVGMGGIGKTTLAAKVFSDHSITDHFEIREWVYVSQEYNRREVFLALLSRDSKLSKNEMYNLSYKMLAESLCKRLSKARYLIVLDDIWDHSVWDDLRSAIPNSENGSRILLTSRSADVALRANPSNDPHRLGLLTDHDSWELFCRKVFQNSRCPSELVEIGQQIVKKCGGLPLAIVSIAGMLCREDRTLQSWTNVAKIFPGMLCREDRTLQSWTNVAKNHSSYEPDLLINTLALSYKYLPYLLKACFLYFGAFPSDFEIPVRILLLLWVAEGFIAERGEQCLEDMAENYLEDLVNRNLVIVTKRSYNGHIKACQIHGLLRELCLAKAAEEQFLREITRYANVQSSSTRRISIHSNVLDYISKEPSDPFVRSFLCFDSEEIPEEYLSFIHKAFKLVRVFDLLPIWFPRFPINIVKLVHLRYLAISGHFGVIPASLSGLWNLQTLIVQTTFHNLDIQADMWKMLEFRHLYTNVSACLRGPHSKAQKHNEDHFIGRNIQTLSMISPSSCSKNILSRTPNLKKLGICGKLLTLVEQSGVSSLFGNIAKLDCLETLKLFNDTYPLPTTESKLPSLPPPYQFPPNLRKLTLSGTMLDWQHISTLGMLPKLEVLKLKDNAFKGERWESLDGGFHRLKVLQLGRTDLVHWEASSYHFPTLQCLALRHCESLKAIPSGLGDVLTLQDIELYFTSSSAAASAREIQQKLQINGGKPRLLIHPTDL